MSDARESGEQAEVDLPAAPRTTEDTLPPQSPLTKSVHRTCDARLPGALVRHPLVVGWCWIALWFGLMALSESLAWPDIAWYAFVALAALPTLVASLVVLQATPREHLKPKHDSVLGHFFVRFVTLIAAFLLWGSLRCDERLDLVHHPGHDGG